MAPSIDTAVAAGLGAARLARPARMLAGFFAGVAGFLIFHQAAVYAGGQLGLIASSPYSSSPAAVTGLPQFVSTAFWAGLWGIVFAFAQTGFLRGAAYWLASILFGAILPTVIYLTLVAALKGLPLLAGGDLERIAAGMVLNGLWGLGTALAYRVIIRA